MPMPPLPRRLVYLQPILWQLADLPADELHEDTDASILDEALLARVAGLSPRRAQRKIDEDRTALQEWLKHPEAPSAAGHFVLGYLLLPGLAEELLSPPEPGSALPRISFDAPAGFQPKPFPSGMNYYRGKLMCCITVIPDASAAEHMRQCAKMPRHLPWPDFQESHTVQEVSFGSVHGTKVVNITEEPARWKHVGYILQVPGGHVSLVLDAFGEDFDEHSVEQQLHTLRVEAVA